MVWGGGDRTHYHTRYLLRRGSSEGREGLGEGLRLWPGGMHEWLFEHRGHLQTLWVGSRDCGRRLSFRKNREHESPHGMAAVERERDGVGCGLHWVPRLLTIAGLITTAGGLIGRAQRASRTSRGLDEERSEGSGDHLEVCGSTGDLWAGGWQ